MSDTNDIQACEFCDKPAEFLSSTEGCGGMGYDAWPLCSDHAFNNLREQMSAEGDFDNQDQVTVWLIARIANGASAESVQRQSKRMLDVVDAEYKRITAEQLYDRLIDERNAMPRREWTTVTVEEVSTIIEACRALYRA